MRLIMECQNRTISRGSRSIFSRLRKEGIDVSSVPLFVHSLRSLVLAPVTEAVLLIISLSPPTLRVMCSPKTKLADECSPRSTLLSSHFEDGVNSNLES